MKRPLAVLVLLVASGLACRTQSMAGKGPPQGLREPAVAGRFYPAEPMALRRAVEKFLGDAVPPKAGTPVALVAPHAGYIFSGQIAADAWRQAEGREVDLVVILGTNHTVPPFRGAAVHPGGGFRTPLGVAEIDRGAAGALIAADAEVAWNGEAHAGEHSVEVQIPFAQVLFPKAKILPLVVGDADPAACERLGQALGAALRGRKLLVVASSDLSHYPSAADAPAVDRAVLAAVARMDGDAVRAAASREMSRGTRGLSTCACGEGPILAAISAARSLGATRGVVASYAHSGDVPVGDPHRVVGYGAVAFAGGAGGPDTGALDPPPAASPDAPLDAADRKALLGLARETIDRYLSTGTVPWPRGLSPRTRRPSGAFVTLTKDGQLRGCIGNMSAGVPLDRVVGAMALRAAFNDARFPPVAPEELPRIRVEISILTPLSPVAGPGDIVVGRDGVLLSKGGRQAVFLPQVATEQGWSRDTMLDQLCLKAGLPAGCWRKGATFSVFRSEILREGEAP